MPTATPTDTLAPTATDTASPSLSPTSTVTFTPTPTDTSVPTATDTLTPTPSDTAVPTATDTLVPTATPTDTLVPTATPTDTATATPTDTLVPTATPTETLVPTATPTETPTETALPTATDTPTPTDTLVPTATPTDTLVPTATPTDTLVPTVTPTATATDTLVSTATPTVVSGEVHIKIEAESGAISGDWQLLPDPLASACGYVQVGSGGAISYNVYIPKTGTYYVWGRAKGDSYSNDSFYLQFDALTQQQWGFSSGKPWEWYPAPAYGSSWTLSQGMHTLTIRFREGGAQLDALEVTDRTHWAAKPGWVAACGTPTVTPTPTDTPTLSVTPTPTDTGVPTATPTLSMMTVTPTATPTATDTVGPTATPSHTATLTAVSGEVHIGIEAESGDSTGDWQLLADGQASACGYVQAGSGGVLSYDVYIPKAATYYVWGRAKGASYSSDSFFIRFDSQTEQQWGFTYGQSWAWYAAPATGSAWGLAKGWHTLTVRFREGGAQLDALEITERNHWAYKPIWIASCGAPTVTPTASVSPTLSITPTPTETAMPTLTPTTGAATATPTATATLVSGEVHIGIEAESGAIVGDWQVLADTLASAGHYVQVGSGGSLSYNVYIPKPATYYIWGRAKAAGSGNDSFFVRFDSQIEQQWGFSYGKPWAWYAAAWAGQSWNLSRGWHTLTVRYREGGAQLDALEITERTHWAYKPNWIE